jgi:citrate lyase subunit beta/citryl-CoA lyase
MLIDSGFLMRDLEFVMKSQVYGFMPTMIRDETDIIYIDKLLTQLERDKGLPVGKLKLCPLIETGSAVLKSYEIGKASERIIGLAFGAEDYLTDLDGLHKENGASILMARSMIVMAARSLHIAAIDTPFLDVFNLNSFRAEVKFAREIGFSGQLILHPNQIEIANQIHTPSEDEVDEASRIISEIEKSSKEGHGVTLLDGKLIGPPMEKRARKILDKAEKIRVFRWKK